MTVLTLTTAVPVRYETGTDVYRRCGMSKKNFYRVCAGDWAPNPTVYVGMQPGWRSDLITLWLRETGRIDVHGRPCRSKRAGRPRAEEEPPTWYSVLPQRYLTAQEGAALIGYERKTIGRLRAQGAGPRPAVLLGQVAGYTIDEIVRVGRHYGWREGFDEASARRNFAQMSAHRNRSLKGTITMSEAQMMSMATAA